MVNDSEREVSLCFASSEISQVDELYVFVLEIVRSTAVCESRLHLCDTDEISGHCAIK